MEESGCTHARVQNAIGKLYCGFILGNMMLRVQKDLSY